MTPSPPPRSRQDLRSAIVSAAARLLREAGRDAVTTRAVAQAAGVQAPTIYRLFGDKDGLLDALAEHVMAAYVATEANAPDTTPNDPVVELRAAWNAHVAFGLANPELYALISARTPQHPSPATAAGIEVLRTRVHRLAAAGLLRVDERRALLMVHAAGHGAVLALLGQPAAVRDLGLADAMFDAVTTSILVTVPPLPDTTTTAVAVTFATAIPGLPGLSDAERTLMREWLTRALTQLHAPAPDTASAAGRADLG